VRVQHSERFLFSKKSGKVRIVPVDRSFLFDLVLVCYSIVTVIVIVSYCRKRVNQEENALFAVVEIGSMHPLHQLKQR